VKYLKILPAGEDIKKNMFGIQSIPAKGWNLLWRIYGPTQDWYDKKWRPSEIELVEWKKRENGVLE
jgi:hypothetical protein